MAGKTKEVQRLPVVDTHTGGEPTRVVVESRIALQGKSAGEKLAFFRSELDHLRRSMTQEPRANDHWVAAWLFPSSLPECEFGVIFMNNVGYLGMCGHGLIGVAVALEHAGKLQPGKHRFETCVGTVTADILGQGQVTMQNVASYCLATAVPLRLPSGKTIHGDIAWGGNWFYLCEDHGAEVNFANLPELLELAKEIRRCLPEQGVTGSAGAEIDHIELFGPASDPAKADSRNFVLCPGGQYDRSPCGTGTSAKLACLAAHKKLAPGLPWRQESIIGSVFEAQYEMIEVPDPPALPTILPTLTGAAYVSAESTLMIDPNDPLRFGIHSS